MGDRGNIVIESGGCEFPHPVYFYTHWGGSDMKEMLAEALVKGKSRWEDSSYLARVIFQRLLGGDDGVTGFGISTAICDNEHPLLCVNMETQTVCERNEGRGEWTDLAKLPVTKSWTFEDFVKEFAEPITAT